MLNGKHKAVFLDRDGTINVDKHYLFRQEDFEYMDGALEGLKVLSDMGFLLVVITNQSGIARGFYTEKDYFLLDTWMKSDLKKRGIFLAKTYFCPHHPKGIVDRYKKACNCRKPGTELFWKAQKELDIDMHCSYAIGDKERDLSICSETDVTGILLSNISYSRLGAISCSNWNEVIKAVQARSV